MSFAVGFTLVFLAGGLGGSSGALTDYLPTICETICNPNPSVPLKLCRHKCGWISTGKYYDGSRCWLLGKVGQLLSTTGRCRSGVCLPNFMHYLNDAHKYCNESIFAEGTTGSSMSDESDKKRNESALPAITVSPSTTLPDLDDVSTARHENSSGGGPQHGKTGDDVTAIGENRTQDDKERDNGDGHEPRKNVTDTPGGNHTTREIPTVSDSLLSQEGGIASRNESTPETSDKYPGVTEAVTTVGGEHSSGDGKNEPQDGHESLHGDTHKPSINVTEKPNVNNTTPPISDLVDGSSSDESRHGSGNKSTAETSDRNATVTEPVSTAPGEATQNGELGKEENCTDTTQTTEETTTVPPTTVPVQNITTPASNVTDVNYEECVDESGSRENDRE